MNSDPLKSPVIILAGGKSSRMGVPKGLLPVDLTDFEKKDSESKRDPVLKFGKLPRFFIETQIFNLAQNGLKEAVVVLGFQSDCYLESLYWLESARQKPGTDLYGVSVFAVLNPKPELGPFSSLQVAGQSIFQRELERKLEQESLQRSPSVWVSPIDVPIADRAVWMKLSEAGHFEAVIPTYGGRGGHPVLLSRKFLDHLLTLDSVDPNSRLDVQMRLLKPEQCLRVPVDDPKILKNFNTPEEWSKWTMGEGSPLDICSAFDRRD